MSLSFWAIHSCQYKGMAYCSELQFLCRKEIFKTPTRSPHHVPLFLSFWFPCTGPRWFSLHCKRSQTSVFLQGKWRREDTDYRKGCRGALHSTESSYRCSASHSTIHKEWQHFLIFGLSATRCMVFLLNRREQNESISSYYILILKVILLLLNITDILTSECHKLLAFLM